MDLGTVTTSGRTTAWSAITGGTFTFSINGTLNSDIRLRTAVILEYREDATHTEKIAHDCHLNAIESVANVQLGAGEVRARLSGGDSSTDIDAFLAIDAGA